MSESKSSPWMWVGIGCGTLALLAGACAVLGGLWTVRSVKRFERAMKDPEIRTTRAKEILGTGELPEGYHAVVALSIPLVADVAVLSDQPPKADGEPSGMGQRGLIYFKTVGVGQNESELRDYFEGRTSDPSVLRDNNISVDADEILGRGVIRRADGDLMYVTQRGSVDAHGVQGDGLTAVVFVDCEGDRKTRVAVWFGPDPDPQATVEDGTLAGTPADESSIAAFLAPFRFCS